MRKLFVFSLVLLVIAVSCSNVEEQQPLKLWYNQPAASWQEALPLGNSLTGANLFTNAHGQVQLDGNFGGAAGIAELLVQSHEGYIQLLPALPDELSSGEVKGLVARGGFVIDMKWDNGSIESLVIHSRLGGNCRIKVNGALTSRDARLEPAAGENPNPLMAKPDQVPFVNNALALNPELNPDPGNIFDFPTEAGKTYRFRLRD